MLAILAKIDKRVYIGLALLIVGVIAFFVIRGKIRKGKGDGTTDEAEKELEELDVKPSYSDYTYSEMADIIYTSLDGAFTNNQETVLSQIERLNNRADWLKLVSSFGVKKSTSMWSDFEGNLVDWLSDEIDDSTVLKKMNAHLAEFDVKF